MPRGSKPGERRGGRAAGTPNKNTRELATRIAEKMGEDWCPVAEMAALSSAKDLPVELRIKLLAEVAPYLAAKRKPMPLADEASQISEVVAAARLRAMRAGGGMSLEGLIVMSGVPEPVAVVAAPAQDAQEAQHRAPTPQPPPPLSPAFARAAGRAADADEPVSWRAVATSGGRALTDYEPSM